MVNHSMHTQMKLHYVSASPFARKVLMAAIELGLRDTIDIVDTVVAPGKENTAYAKKVNPLRKIPALEVNNKLIILDSTVICEYLNDLEGNHRLMPLNEPDKWKVKTAHAIANGIMDAAVLIRYETFLRPESNRWPVWIDEQWEKINNALEWFDTNDNAPMATIDGIALACCLGYLDFRFAEFDWRHRYKNLSKWQTIAAQSASYRETKPD